MVYNPTLTTALGRRTNDPASNYTGQRNQSVLINSFFAVMSDFRLDHNRITTKVAVHEDNFFNIPLLINH